MFCAETLTLTEPSEIPLGSFVHSDTVMLPIDIRGGVNLFDNVYSLSITADIISAEFQVLSSFSILFAKSVFPLPVKSNDFFIS